MINRLFSAEMNMDYKGDGSAKNHTHDMNMMCPMIMNFHFGHCETILWKAWTAKTVVEFSFSSLGIFFIAFIYEYLKYLGEKYCHTVARSELIRIKNEGNTKCIHGNNSSISNASSSSPTPCLNISENDNEKSIYENIFNPANLFQTLLHLIQVTTSYLLMLIVMTYNYWLCLAIVLGAACGHFCFGWIRQQVTDFNEHCH